MAVAVFFHAHPDDEAILTAGTMARASEAGHRVVLVLATRGELGEVAEELAASPEAVAELREREVAEAARILGVHRHEYLGYTDSGMDGEPQNQAPGCFWAADTEEAAGRLAAILTEERADVLVAYDEWGNYGHPDHIKVHHVGVRAAELAGTPRVYEATTDRGLARELNRLAEESGAPMPVELDEHGELPLGVPSHLITTRVDVRPWLERKRAAMAAHASQIAPDSFFLALPPALFELTWGTEFF
ncbi:MAG TPA: PIG-L family deacetylase, partial [Acidimicrobiales bacterium]|nr:PIG-L family deacetylase [Acidimicrobiales bacterium]